MCGAAIIYYLFMVIFSRYLVKDGLIWTEEAPLDISVPCANVKDLAVGGWVGVVAISSADATETQVLGNFCQILGHNHHPNAEQGQSWNETQQDEQMINIGGCH